jgi:hypothetical protein
MASENKTKEQKSTGVTKIKPSFPARAYIQRFDDVPPDYQLVADELKLRGINVVFKTTEDILRKAWPLTREDFVCGNFDWTRLAMKKLNITMPEPPDYPVCLKHLLQRRVWQSTLGEVNTFLQQPENKTVSVFIKPAATAKAFAAIVEPRDQMLSTLLNGIEGIMDSLPANTPIHCSELVDMVTEYRVYVVDHKIRATCQYRGPTGSSEIKLDNDIVNKAVAAVAESSECRDLTGYAVDFAVVKKKTGEYITCLVELNDGYSLGRYAGLSGKDYTDLLIARWAMLMGQTTQEPVQKDNSGKSTDKKPEVSVNKTTASA